MNYKKLFLTIMSIFCLVVEFGVVYGMESQQIVTYKSLNGMPCLTLNKFIQSWGDMPQDKREEIRKQIIASRNEQFLALFNVATMLPSDVQGVVAMQFANGDDHGFKAFFNDPIIDTLKTLSREIFHGNEFFKIRRRLHDSENWKPDVIFEHLHDVMVFNSKHKNHNTCNYEQLKSINSIYSTFQDSEWLSNYNAQIDYTYRDSYTLSSFIKYQSIVQWGLLPFVLIPFFIELAHWGMDSDGLTIKQVQKIVNHNQKIETVNLFIHRT